VGEVGLGFLMGALGVGAIIGAFVIAGIHSGRRGMWLTWGDILGSVFLVLFSLTTSYYWALGLIVFVGAFNTIRQALSNSLIQINAPDEFQGRVMSVFNLLFNGMSRVGALMVGGLGEVIGVPLALGICAVLSLVWSGFVVLRMPIVRRLE
jgi:MFS-type transporter involved in bile tolerance (Atg22 family)